MAIKAWTRYGSKPNILAKGWGGKALLNQTFINPETNESKDITLWGIVKKDGELLQTGWSSIIMAVTEKLEVIAVKQFRYGANEITLEVPGGNPNPNFKDNSPKAVGVHELGEETGYTPRKVIQLAQYAFYEPASTSINYYPCLALDCYPTPEKKENNPNEMTEVVLIPFEKYLQMAFSGEIIDSKTGLLLVMSLPHILGVEPKTLAQKIISRT